jgi:hypothetical protein
MCAKTCSHGVGVDFKVPVIRYSKCGIQLSIYFVHVCTVLRARGDGGDCGLLPPGAVLGK